MTGAEPTTVADVYSLGKLAQKLLEASLSDRELEVFEEIGRGVGTVRRRESMDVIFMAAYILPMNKLQRMKMLATGLLLAPTTSLLRRDRRLRRGIGVLGRHAVAGEGLFGEVLVVHGGVRAGGRGEGRGAE